MRFPDVQLPSNRKFGLFFSAVFTIIGAYYFWVPKYNLGYFFAALAISFGIVTALKAELLLPLNKIWMRLGLLLGMIVSPIVLGILFFGMFTPIAILMRLFGRDELRLKQRNSASYWRFNEVADTNNSSFKQQF